MYHSIFLSVCVGGLATDLTIYILLGLENIYFTISMVQIIWNLKKSSPENMNRATTDLMILVLGETLEIIIPLAYMVCFIVAYYGPNAEVLGNIKNDYWQYKAVDDPMDLIQNLLLLVGVDSVMLVIITIILYCCCNVNLFYVYMFILKEYGATFAIQIMALMHALFCGIAVACALDFTFKFDWWLDQGKWQNMTGIVMRNQTW